MKITKMPTKKEIEETQFRVLDDDEIVTYGHYCAKKGCGIQIIKCEKWLDKKAPAKEWREEWPDYEFFAEASFFGERFNFLEGCF